MFDIGWTELLVLAIVAIIVVGPKDLPRMLRSLGKTLGQVRRTANDFKRQFDDALREAEREADLDDARKTMQSLRDPLSDVRKGVEKDLDSASKIGRDVKKPIGSAETADDSAAGSQWVSGAAKPQSAQSAPRAPAAGVGKAQPGKTEPGKTAAKEPSKDRPAGQARAGRPAAGQARAEKAQAAAKKAPARTGVKATADGGDAEAAGKRSAHKGSTAA
jgi:sec-independent protein translocase protein TatB